MRVRASSAAQHMCAGSAAAHALGLLAADDQSDHGEHRQHCAKTAPHAYAPRSISTATRQMPKHADSTTRLTGSATMHTAQQQRHHRATAAAHSDCSSMQLAQQDADGSGTWRRDRDKRSSMQLTQQRMSMQMAQRHAEGSAASAAACNRHMSMQMPQQHAEGPAASAASCN